MTERDDRDPDRELGPEESAGDSERGDYSTTGDWGRQGSWGAYGNRPEFSKDKEWKFEQSALSDQLSAKTPPRERERRDHSDKEPVES